MILSASLLSFFIAFLLLKNKLQTVKANYFLVCYFFDIALSMFAYHLILKSELNFILAYLLIQCNPIFILLGPLLYFHIKFKIDETSTIKFKNILHLLPSLLILIYQISHYGLPFSKKLYYAKLISVEFSTINDIPLSIVNSQITFFTMAIISFFYLLLSLYFLIKNLKISANAATDKLNHKKTIRWLFYLLFFSIFIFGGLALPVFSFNKVDNLYSLYVATSATFLLIMYLMFCPYILYGSNQTYLPKITEINTIKLPKSKLLNLDELIKIDHLIIQYLISVPFTHSDFNLNKVSLDLGLPRYKLTYYLNQHIKLSFNAWRDFLRINFVKTLLINGAANTFTLESIGRDAGYHSRDKFTRAFKTQTGVNPSKFLKKCTLLTKRD